MDKKIIGILLTPLLAIALLILLFAPIIPVQVAVTETRTRNLLFETQEHLTPYLDVEGGNVTDAHGNTIYRTDYVNVTNCDIIGGNFSITLSKFYRSYDFRSGPINKLENTITQSAFIAAGASEVFTIPQSWGHLNTNNTNYELGYGTQSYELDIDVFSPTIQENYTVTNTEYRSIVTLST